MAKNIADNKTDGIVKKTIPSVVLLYKYSILIIRNHLVGRFSFFLPKRLGGVSHYDVENDSFLIGNMQ